MTNVRCRAWTWFFSLFKGPNPWDFLFSYFGERNILDDAMTNLIFCEGDGPDGTNSRTMTMTENRAFFYCKNIHPADFFLDDKHFLWILDSSYSNPSFLAFVILSLGLLLVRGRRGDGTPYYSMTSS